MAEALREIKVPPLGESVREATVAKWRKNVGESVQQDEIVVELETDKVTMEVGAPTSGVLQEISANSGENIEVGGILGKIAQGSEADIASSKSAKTASPKKISESSLDDEPLPPSVRKMLEEAGVKSSDISGSGKDGRVTKGDVIGFKETAKVLPAPSQAPSSAPSTPTPIASSAPSASPSSSPSSQPASAPQRTSDRREERVRMTRLRARIAERLKMAQNTAAILTTFNEIDMSGINSLRARYKEFFEKKHGIKLGMMSFFVKAAIQALKEIPAVNSEIDGDDIIYKNYYDIGIAVSTPQGLVVPVVRNADQLSFAEIEKEIVSLGQRARDGKLTIDDMTGGTFTITNGGIFGSLMATPIINPPQTGILGMHKIQERPIVIDGKIEIRPMMYVALSYDHRIIDGKESVTFLVRVKENLEHPERLLLEI